MNPKRLHRRIFLCLLFFMIALLMSGLTAFPLNSELNWLDEHKNLFPEFIGRWISIVHNGVQETGINFPFIMYGTDWLAFAHVVIAIAFIGPMLDPIKNKWVVQWGIINCILIFPLALIAGPIRSIPVFHQLIDCSFGLIGLIPLLIALNDIKKLEKLIDTKNVQ